MRIITGNSHTIGDNTNRLYLNTNTVPVRSCAWWCGCRGCGSARSTTAPSSSHRCWARPAPHLFAQLFQFGQHVQYCTLLYEICMEEHACEARLPHINVNVVRKYVVGDVLLHVISHGSIGLSTLTNIVHYGWKNTLVWRDYLI